jgi:DNA repair exonuclease SbcCD ATPase subunit
MSTFRLHRLRLVRDDGDQHWNFASGVTVFVGPVGVGKTSLFELIKYSLGGNGVLSRAVQEVGRRVVLDVELQTGRFELSRSLGRKRNVVEILADGEVRRTLPLRGKANQQTLSDWLLDNAGIPRVRLSPSRSSRSKAASRYARVGFADIYRYMYLEQAEIDRSTVRHLDKILNPHRVRAFEVLYGITGPEIAELEAEVSRIGEKLTEHRARTSAIETFLAATDPGGSLELARAEVGQVKGRHAAATQQLRMLREQARQASVSVSGLRESSERIEAQLRRAREQRAEWFAQIERLRLARAGAISGRSRALLAASATEAFAGLSYDTCPRCLQTLAEHHAHDRCVLCGQVEPGTVTVVAVQVERDRLERQVLETDELMDQAVIESEAIDRLVGDLELEAAAIRERINQEASVSVTPFVENIASHTAEAARLEERQLALEIRIGQYQQLQALRDEATTLANELDEKEQRLAAAQGLRDQARDRVDDFSNNFTQTLKRFEPPWYQSSRIDLKTYLPVVDGQGLENNSAGVKTMINDAYYLANIMTALQQPNVIHLPGLLIIDSPRKNFGSGQSDRATGQRIYSIIDALQAANHGRLQMLIADNDLPAKFNKNFKVVRLSYDNPLLNAVKHPGGDQVQTLDSQIEADRNPEAAATS